MGTKMEKFCSELEIFAPCVSCSVQDYLDRLSAFLSALLQPGQRGPGAGVQQLQDRRRGLAQDTSHQVNGADLSTTTDRLEETYCTSPCFPCIQLLSHRPVSQCSIH
jgi:hypothetical protein